VTPHGTFFWIADHQKTLFLTVIPHRWCIVHGILGAHVWPLPVLRPLQVGRSSGVNQEMNFFWQNGGNVSDDVTP
jgi:hypothetical protein